MLALKRLKGCFGNNFTGVRIEGREYELGPGVSLLDVLHLDLVQTLPLCKIE